MPSSTLLNGASLSRYIDFQTRLEVAHKERLRDLAKLGERVLREIYLPGFEAALRTGGAAGAMCSFRGLTGPAPASIPTC